MKFKKLEDADEYSVWSDKNDYLGSIGKRKYGKQYCFFPYDFQMIGDMWFYENCLRDIADKLKELNSK
jgi:hypothetical protein